MERHDPKVVREVKEEVKKLQEEWSFGEWDIMEPTHEEKMYRLRSGLLFNLTGSIGDLKETSFMAKIFFYIEIIGKKVPIESLTMINKKKQKSLLMFIIRNLFSITDYFEKLGEKNWQTAQEMLISTIESTLEIMISIFETNDIELLLSLTKEPLKRTIEKFTSELIFCFQSKENYEKTRNKSKDESKFKKIYQLIPKFRISSAIATMNAKKLSTILLDDHQNSIVLKSISDAIQKFIDNHTEDNVRTISQTYAYCNSRYSSKKEKNHLFRYFIKLINLWLRISIMSGNLDYIVNQETE